MINPIPIDHIIMLYHAPSERYQCQFKKLKTSLTAFGEKSMRGAHKLLISVTPRKKIVKPIIAPKTFRLWLIFTLFPSFWLNKGENA